MRIPFVSLVLILLFTNLSCQKNKEKAPLVKTVEVSTPSKPAPAMDKQQLASARGMERQNYKTFTFLNHNPVYSDTDTSSTLLDELPIQQEVGVLAASRDLGYWFFIEYSVNDIKKTGFVPWYSLASPFEDGPLQPQNSSAPIQFLFGYEYAPNERKIAKLKAIQNRSVLSELQIGKEWPVQRDFSIGKLNSLALTHVGKAYAVRSAAQSCGEFSMDSIIFWNGKKLIQGPEIVQSGELGDYSDAKIYLPTVSASEASLKLAAYDPYASENGPSTDFYSPEEAAWEPKDRIVIRSKVGESWYGPNQEVLAEKTPDSIYFRSTIVQRAEKIYQWTGSELKLSSEKDLLKAAQQAEEKACPFSEKIEGTKPEDFVPAPWLIKTQRKGDLNQDDREDFALVLECYHGGRTLLKQRPNLKPIYSSKKLLLLFGSEKGLRLVSRKDQLIPSFDLTDGSKTQQDPFKDLKIQGNLLSLHFNLGGTESWEKILANYEFRHQNGELRLTGFDFSQSNSSDQKEEEKVSIDFQAKKIEVKKILEGGQATTETREFKLEKLKTFQEMQKPFQWEWEGFRI